MAAMRQATAPPRPLTLAILLLLLPLAPFSTPAAQAQGAADLDAVAEPAPGTEPVPGTEPAPGAETSPGAEPAPDAARGLGPPTTLDGVGAGSLLLRSGRPGLYRTAPLLDTDVRIRVTGFVARTRVAQRFWNPTADWVEGIYAFPLPESSGVDALTLKVGDRVLEGQIQEREEARKTYEKAKAEGKKATLLEQHRPNLFTTAVAQLGPDEVAEVIIEYQQELRYEAGPDGRGRFELRFPMVVAPRYDPGACSGRGCPGAAAAARFAAGVAPGAAGTPEVLAQPRVEPPPPQPPFLPPGSDAANAVSLAVDLDPGFPLARLESPSHPLDRRRLGPSHWRVALASQVVAADRDFVLSWSPKVGRAPQAALFTEEWGGDLYALLMVLPPGAGEVAPEAALDREVIFVIDTSGSMGGPSLRQAQAALLSGLGLLRAGDWFNVIQFNSITERLFPGSVAATPDHLDAARRYVDGLRADGGTEMLPALGAALGGDAAGDAVRQVIFITDGQVGDEEELFGFLKAHLGASRLFPVGIGAAPNSYFMAKAAAFGRGTFTYVGDPSEVGEKMEALFAKLASPVLADLEVEWDDPTAEAWPPRVPDLYLGEPVVVAARLVRRDGDVVVRGRTAERPWEVRLPLASGAAEGGLDKLWARRKIASLMGQLSDGTDPAEVRRGVLEVALGHHLVSKFTSLVAVDVTPTAPAGTLPSPRAVPVDLPAGWGGLGEPAGALPQGATPARLDLLLGLFLLAAAALALRVAARDRP
jgi:Ca-activated chloride channel homolog